MDFGVRCRNHYGLFVNRLEEFFCDDCLLLLLIGYFTVANVLVSVR